MATLNAKNTLKTINSYFVGILDFINLIIESLVNFIVNSYAASQMFIAASRSKFSGHKDCDLDNIMKSIDKKTGESKNASANLEKNDTVNSAKKEEPSQAKLDSTPISPSISQQFNFKINYVTSIPSLHTMEEQPENVLYVSSKGEFAFVNKLCKKIIYSYNADELEEKNYSGFKIQRSLVNFENISQESKESTLARKKGAVINTIRENGGENVNGLLENNELVESLTLYLDRANLFQWDELRSLLTKSVEMLYRIEKRNNESKTPCEGEENKPQIQQTGANKKNEPLGVDDEDDDDDDDDEYEEYKQRRLEKKRDKERKELEENSVMHILYKHSSKIDWKADAETLSKSKNIRDFGVRICGRRSRALGCGGIVHSDMLSPEILLGKSYGHTASWRQITESVILNGYYLLEKLDANAEKINDNKLKKLYESYMQSRIEYEKMYGQNGYAREKNHLPSPLEFLFENIEQRIKQMPIFADIAQEIAITDWENLSNQLIETMGLMQIIIKNNLNSENCHNKRKTDDSHAEIISLLLEKNAEKQKEFFKRKGINFASEHLLIEEMSSQMDETEQENALRHKLNQKANDAVFTPNWISAIRPVIELGYKLLNKLTDELVCPNRCKSNANEIKKLNEAYLHARRIYLRDYNQQNFTSNLLTRIHDQITEMRNLWDNIKNHTKKDVTKEQNSTSKTVPTNTAKKEVEKESQNSTGTKEIFKEIQGSCLEIAVSKKLTQQELKDRELGLKFWDKNQNALPQGNEQQKISNVNVLEQSNALNHAQNNLPTISLNA